MTASEQLRQVIRASGLTHYRIGVDLNISIRTVDRFVTEGRKINTDTFDVLCDYLGMELRPAKRAGKNQEAAPKQPAKKRAAKTK